LRLIPHIAQFLLVHVPIQLLRIDKKSNPSCKQQASLVQELLLPLTAGEKMDGPRSFFTM